MNKLTQTLLSGAALSALTTLPAVALDAPRIHFTALHGGRALNKTKFHNPHRCRDDTCTVYAYTTVSAADYRERVNLVQTFYKLNSNSTLCSTPAQRLLAPRKSQYGSVRGATETYSEGCPSGPTVFYGVTYKLTDKAGFGQTDTFMVRLKDTLIIHGRKYKGTLYIFPIVNIGSE